MASLRQITSMAANITLKMTVKVLFMGRKKVAAQCLKYLLSQKNVEVVGVITDSHKRLSVTRDVALENDVTLFDYDSALTAMREQRLSFDIGFSMLFWRRFKEEFLSLPRLGLINFHPAILPDYKGTAGYNIAILEGRTDWGVSAHYVDEGIDTGCIIDVAKFPICPDSETALSLETKSQIYLLEQFKRISGLALVSDGRLHTVPNNEGRYICRAEMESMKEVREGDDIHRKIRAFWFPPYDGAFVTIDGQKYTLVDNFILRSLSNTEID